MANLTRIKILNTGATTAAPSNIKTGELAYSWVGGTQGNNGDRLYIGTGTESGGVAPAVAVIGGKYFVDLLDHVAGTTTASSALITDGNSHVSALNKIVGSPTSEVHMRNRMTKYWAAFPTIVLMGLPNVVQAAIWSLAQVTGNGDDDDSWYTFGNEPGHKLHVDITPFLRTIGVWDEM